MAESWLQEMCSKAKCLSLNETVKLGLQQDKWKHEYKAMPPQELRLQQGVKIRRTTIGFGILQVILGLVLTTLSFTAFSLTESDRIRNACPYWAGFTVSLSQNVCVDLNQELLICLMRYFVWKTSLNLAFDVLYFHRFFFQEVWVLSLGDTLECCRWVSFSS